MLCSITWPVRFGKVSDHAVQVVPVEALIEPAPVRLSDRVESAEKAPELLRDSVHRDLSPVDRHEAASEVPPPPTARFVQTNRNAPMCTVILDVPS